MKKIFAFALMVASLASCGEKKVDTEAYKADMEAYNQWRKEIVMAYRAEGANTDSLEKVYTEHVKEVATKHIGDSLGLRLTIEEAMEMDIPQLDSVLNLCDMYKENEKLNSIMKSAKARQATSAGCNYVDVEGIDPNTGEKKKLSEIIALGKPVVVDFWASWCGPCRKEIKDYLANYATKYADKVNVVGIAVWEDTITTTQKAMGQLPISWPIIFAGSRLNSPTEAYGIMGIPQIMVIGADGIIKARDLRGEAIEAAIEEALAK